MVSGDASRVSSSPDALAVELRGGGLVLRPWREDDAEGVYLACRDPEILHWMPSIPRPYTRSDAQAFVTGRLNLGPHQFAIAEYDRPIGSIGIRIDDQKNGHISFWCAREARGRGVATQALRMLCEYALAMLGAERLELVADPDNRASQRVAEKVGFRPEGVLRSHLLHPGGRRRDSIMFSLLPGELR
jgi:RimJ/RimL family protein N-acetyltransferase